MWLDSIENNTEIKQVYGRDPIFKDAVLYFIIDNTQNTVIFDIDFFDWPTPLPEKWYVTKITCVSLKMAFKDVHFNHVDLSKDFIKCNIDIEATEDSRLHIKVSDNEGFCFYDFTAKSANVVDFRFWDHAWD